MANTAKLAWRFSRGDVGAMIVTAHVKAADSRAEFDETDLGALADAGCSWWTTPPPTIDVVQLSDAYPEHTRLEDVAAMTIQPALSDTVVSIPTHQPGTFGTPISPFGSVYPPQCCYLIGLRTSDDSRQGRGRMYLPTMAFLSDGSGTTGRIDDELCATLGKFGASLAEWVRAAIDEDPPVVLAVYSRVAHVAHAVLHFEVATRIATQRRRAYRPVSHLNFGLDGEP